MKSNQIKQSDRSPTQRKIVVISVHRCHVGANAQQATEDETGDQTRFRAGLQVADHSTGSDAGREER